MNPVESPLQFRTRYIHTPTNEGESAPDQLVRMIGERDRLNARDAAIRRQVLDRVERYFTGSEIVKMGCDRIRAEYASQEKAMKCEHESVTFHPDPSGNNDSGYTCNQCGADVENPGPRYTASQQAEIDAADERKVQEDRDAATARAAKVEVLRQAMLGLDHAKFGVACAVIQGIAKGNGIDPAELEPVKVYTVGDIKVGVSDPHWIIPAAGVPSDEKIAKVLADYELPGIASAVAVNMVRHVLDAMGLKEVGK